MSKRSGSCDVDEENFVSDHKKNKEENGSDNLSNVPYGWRHRLSISNKQIKQSKLFRTIILEQSERDRVLPSMRPE